MVSIAWAFCDGTGTSCAVACPAVLCDEQNFTSQRLNDGGFGMMSQMPIFAMPLGFCVFAEIERQARPPL